MEILAAAGAQGIRNADLARVFSEPATLQQRLSWTGKILGHFQNAGRARRAAYPEHSEYYQHSPVYRWFITPAGQQYLANGMRSDAAVARDLAATARKVRNEQQAALIAAARDRYGPSRYGQGTPACEREAVIRELSTAGCGYPQIGAVFGLTRERTRQIALGIAVTPCRCSRHGSRRAADDAARTAG